MSAISGISSSIAASFVSQTVARPATGSPAPAPTPTSSAATQTDADGDGDGDRLDVTA